MLIFLSRVNDPVKNEELLPPDSKPPRGASSQPAGNSLPHAQAQTDPLNNFLFLATAPSKGPVKND